MNPGYTAEEKRWLKKHWRNEFYFLRGYGLKIFDDDDRKEGRALVQSFMEVDEPEPNDSQAIGQPHVDSIPTWHDETHRPSHIDQCYQESMGNVTSLTGYLEHHAVTTDGSFGICIASGRGLFISQALYDSISEEHRPPLNTNEAIAVPNIIFEKSLEAVGSTVISFILHDKITNTRFRLKMHALVVPNLAVAMFLGTAGGIRHSSRWTSEEAVYTLKLDHGRTVTVQD